MTNGSPNMDRSGTIRNAFLTSEHTKPIIRILLLFLAAGMMWFGIARGEVETVYQKAVNICLECIGLG